MELFTQVIGWVGTFLVILAYFLVSTKKVNAESKFYQLLNLFGAIGIGINVFHQSAWPALVLQVVWAIIAVFSIIRIKKRSQ